MRRLGVLLALCVAITLGVAVSASAGRPFNQATGELWLSGPSQYLSFNAFDYGPNSSLDRGTVTYDNFDYPVGSGYLSYTAPVLCATVSSTTGTARWMYRIPSGFPGLSGIYVVMSVTDRGSPAATHDTYGHTATWDLGTAESWCENGVGVTNYTIVAGNLVVH